MIQGLSDIEDALGDILDKAEERDRIALADAMESFRQKRPTDYNLMMRNEIFNYIRVNSRK